MASSSREKPRKAKGIRIDSSLISTASSGDIQNELEGLGVSVFDQCTFEEGVMKQLDKEVTRRTNKQERKFLLEEYSRVKLERSTLRHELEALAKKIASLLSRPLCDVVLLLREMKSTQEQKRKQLLQLDVREQEILKKLSGKNDAETANEVGVVSDAAFALPTTSWNLEQQRLIQTGHMTPFGTSELHTTPLQEEREMETADAENTSAAAATNSSGLQLCSEGFDGLFEDQSTTAKPDSKKGVSGRGRKGKERKQMTEIGGGEGCEDATGERVRGEVGEEEEEEEEWMLTRDEVEDIDRAIAEETDWKEEDGEDGSTEYSTDEELGADHVLGRVPAKKKRKRRLLSSGESEEGDEGGRWGRRRRRRRLSQASQHLDDGDEEVFRLRMREEGDTAEGRSASDEVIDGRLFVPGSVWSRLYGYQRTCVRWLWELHCQQAGGVVGDEMGLGKTIEMIAFLAALRVSRLRSHVTRELGLGPVLIVCPATVMHQWVSEFHSWWPQFRVAVLHDTGTHRGPKSALVEDIVKCNGVLVTTYAGARVYRDHLLPQKWDYVILDEGHKIRNPDTEITLTCKQFSTPHRIILSGCPMQNNLRELWSLFDFVFPGKLGTLPVFMEQFSVPITLGGYANATQVQVQTAYRCACILRDTINPYLLRRLKADVKIQLPSKNEQVLFCKLTDYQQELYEEYVTGPDVAAMLVGRKKIFTGLTVMRKLCNHPDLVTNDYRECVTYGKGEEGESGEDEEEEDRLFIRSRARKPLKRKRSSSTQDSEVEGGEQGAGQTAEYCEEKFGWGKRSGKMIVVEALLKMWCEQNHRVLLFSQSKMMLDILEQMIQARSYSYVRMDGGTPIKARQPLIRKFNETPSIFVFLLTTRVGGLGVNLTGADRLIIYDPDWNPSTDTQARERAWRIGQKRQVTIYRLLTSGTIEEKIYHRQIFKQFLSNRVLKDPRQRRFFKANDLYELFSLGQIRPQGETETSAIFAGTGSNVVPKKLKKKRRSRDRGSGLLNSLVKSCDPEVGSCDDKSGGFGDGELKSRKDKEWNGDSQNKAEGEWNGDSQNTVEGEWNRDKAEGEGKRERGGGEVGEDDTVGKGDEALITSDHGSLEPLIEAVEDGKDSVYTCNETSNSKSKLAEHLSLSSSGAAPFSSVTVKHSADLALTGGREGAATHLGDGTGEDHQEMRCSGQFSDLLASTSGGQSAHCRETTTENDKGRERKRRKEHKKRRRHKKRRGSSDAAMVEGVEISGVEHTGLYRTTGDEEHQHAGHDEYILNKLFKKSGVHSAIQHDSIMSSGSADYVVIETEAKKVAQSAARALRESRRRCLGVGRGRGGGGWGQLTWTGQHGSAGGRQQPRFGARVNQAQTKVAAPSSSKLFNGQKAGTSVLSSSKSSPSHTSSSSLLSAMRSRNAHSLPRYAVKDIHKSTHDNLMREIRDFIATRCKFDGQASTEELLEHFSSQLPNSDTATFRSMLREICDFTRIHGEGRWILKSQFR